MNTHYDARVIFLDFSLVYKLQFMYFNWCSYVTSHTALLTSCQENQQTNCIFHTKIWHKHFNKLVSYSNIFEICLFFAYIGKATDLYNVHSARKPNVIHYEAAIMSIYIAHWCWFWFIFEKLKYVFIVRFSIYYIEDKSAPR